MKTKIDGILVEWDDEKNKANQLKHHISFQTAARVFNDDNRVEIPDDAHSVYEDRYIAIGRVNNILFVVYTERCDYIRIISARLATARERKFYYDSQNVYP